MSGTTSSTTASATGKFHVSNGKVIDPNGNTFIAKGINLYDSQMGAASQVLAAFPGINFIRLNIYSYQSPSAYQSFINTMTSKGIVVELEDHLNSTGGNSGGGQGSAFTGQQLTNELNWYSATAKAYASNPYVWFGTNNEPPLSGLDTWEQQTYNAIRNAGNTAPVMIEMPGGGWPNNDISSYGLNPSVYKAMTNIIGDPHFYGWGANYSTDPTTVYNALTNIVKGTQTFVSADGTIPVMIGEYGPATDGTNTDANGQQVIDAVQKGASSGLTSGAIAWGWYPGPNDLLTDGSGHLTSFGKDVADWFQTMPPLHFDPSDNYTEVMAGSTDAIIDATGNKWTIVGGAVQVNGNAAGYSSNVAEIAYVDGAVWQENTSKLWWKWDGTTWPGAGTATSPLPAAKPDDTLTIRVQETAWQGDAKFNVKMDGVQVGGTLTASALKASNDSNVFVLKGNWASGAHNVQIQFINDAYGGSATTDRNLYVNSIDYNGKTYANTAAALMGNSTKSFTVGGNTTVGAAPYDTLTLHLSQDAYSGNAQFVLTIDGKTISTPQDVTALHSAGAWQDVSFSGNFGAGTHTVGVQFTNDAYGGSGNDRNLYVNGVDCNGTHYGSGVTSLYSNGTATFTITTQH